MDRNVGLPKKRADDSEKKRSLDFKPTASRQVQEDLQDQDADSDHISKPLVVTHNERWEDAFNRLKAFQQEQGHCEVPFRYAPDTRLGRWVAFQRTMYRRMREGKSDTVSLTEERIRRLEEIGFEWTVRAGSKLSTWELRFNDLLKYKRRFGHCKLPDNWEENEELSEWVKTQCAEARGFRAGRDSRITRDQIERLSNIGFVWDDDRGTRPVPSAQLFNPGASVGSNPLQRQAIAGLQVASQLQQPSLAPYLASSSSLQQLQAQIGSLRSLPSLAQSQVPMAALPPQLAARTDALEHASMLREALERRALHQSIYPAGFAMGAAFNAVAANSPPSSLAPQSTILEHLSIQQALEANRSRSLYNAAQAVAPIFPFAERSLLALSLPPNDLNIVPGSRHLHPRLIDVNPPTGAGAISLAPTFDRSNLAFPYLTAAFADEKTESGDDREDPESTRR